MDKLRKRFVMLVAPVALILFASFLAAQGPPNTCLNACRQAHTNAVKACHGDQACLAAARAAALACVQGCGLPPR
jgi:hypothetical protein